jgi:hypothetical protein
MRKIENEKDQKILDSRSTKVFANSGEKTLEFIYGEFNAGLWHEAVAFRGSGRGGAGARETH